MTKLVREADAVVAAARHFSFPPPRTATAGSGGDSCRKMVAQIDLGAVVMGSWLDSMKTSSPRHRPMAPVPAVVGGGGDPEHDDWMERHPSALGRFEALAAAKGKQIAVFLDYDGSPIVEDPDRAVVTDEMMRDAVRGVAARFPTAIVSRRCRDKGQLLKEGGSTNSITQLGTFGDKPDAESKRVSKNIGIVCVFMASLLFPMLEIFPGAKNAGALESMAGTLKVLGLFTSMILLMHSVLARSVAPVTVQVQKVATAVALGCMLVAFTLHVCVLLPAAPFKLSWLYLLVGAMGSATLLCGLFIWYGCRGRIKDRDSAASARLPV